MTNVFLDTGFFVALANERDRDHKRMGAISQRVMGGELGQPYTSDYVLDEAVTTALVRTGRLDKAVAIGKIILGNESEGISPFAKMLRVDEGVFDAAWQNFSSTKFKDRNLSFTDHTILVQMRSLALEALVSLDSGFDGLVSRIF